MTATPGSAAYTGYGVFLNMKSGTLGAASKQLSNRGAQCWLLRFVERLGLLDIAGGNRNQYHARLYERTAISPI